MVGSLTRFLPLDCLPLVEDADLYKLVQLPEVRSHL